MESEVLGDKSGSKNLFLTVNGGVLPKVIDEHDVAVYIAFL
jgi:hypothetical protein